MARRIFWPEREEQAICQAFIHDFPVEGYGMCSVFGFVRRAGWAREAARELVLQQVSPPQEEQGGTLPR